MRLAWGLIIAQLIAISAKAGVFLIYNDTPGTILDFDILHSGKRVTRGRCLYCCNIGSKSRPNSLVMVKSDYRQVEGKECGVASFAYFFHAQSWISIAKQRDLDRLALPGRNNTNGWWDVTVHEDGRATIAPYNQRREEDWKRANKPVFTVNW